MRKIIFQLGLLFSFLNAGFCQSVTLLPGNTTEGTVVSRSTNPIITMYGNGALQTSKMLFSYSPSFLDWGLQYMGSGVNKMNFIGSGLSAMAVDLGNRRVGVNKVDPGYTLDVNGTVNASTYLLNGTPTNPLYYFASNWLTSPTVSVDTTIDGTCFRSRRLPAPELTTAMMNGGVVLVYFRVGGIGPYLLPYTSDAGGATNQINFFMKKPGEMIVTRHTLNTCRFNSGIPESFPGQPVLVNLPQSLEYRYVIIKN